MTTATQLTPDELWIIGQILPYEFATPAELAEKYEASTNDGDTLWIYESVKALAANGFLSLFPSGALNADATISAYGELPFKATATGRNAWQQGKRG